MSILPRKKKYSISIVTSLLVLSVVSLHAATMEEGLAFKKAENFPAAAQVFREVMKESPNNSDAIEQLATVTGWMGDHVGALALWEQAIVRFPQRGLPKIGRARV